MERFELSEIEVFYHLLDELNKRVEIGYHNHFDMFGRNSISVYTLKNGRKDKQLFQIKADTYQECYTRAIRELKDYLKRSK